MKKYSIYDLNKKFGGSWNKSYMYAFEFYYLKIGNNFIAYYPYDNSFQIEGMAEGFKPYAALSEKDVEYLIKKYIKMSNFE